MPEANLQSVAIEVVLEQHAEEAGFHWLLRDKATSEPHYSLADLAHLDGRVEAHIDGLRVAGDVGWELCDAALKSAEAGDVYGEKAKIDPTIKIGITYLRIGFSPMVCGSLLWQLAND